MLGNELRRFVSAPSMLLREAGLEESRDDVPARFPGTGPVIPSSSYGLPKCRKGRASDWRMRLFT